jgi:hypothetical protein
MMADANYYGPVNHEAASKIAVQGNLSAWMFGRRTQVFPVEAGQL